MQSIEAVPSAVCHMAARRAAWPRDVTKINCFISSALPCWQWGHGSILSRLGTRHRLPVRCKIRPHCRVFDRVFRSRSRAKACIRPLPGKKAMHMVRTLPISHWFVVFDSFFIKFGFEPSAKPSHHCCMYCIHAKFVTTACLPC